MPVFRSSSGNRYLEGLFYERTGADKSTVVYTLKDQDHLGYPSLYRLYMEANDPLEHAFATAHLDGWEHWTMLCECAWFKPLIERWRLELELRIRSEALVRLIADAKSGSKSAHTSNRILVQRGWDTKKNTKGRPSKADVKAEAKRIAINHQEQAEDLARITAVN